MASKDDKWVYLVEVRKDVRSDFIATMTKSKKIRFTELSGGRCELRGADSAIREATFYPLMVGHIEVVRCDRI